MSSGEVTRVTEIPVFRNDYVTVFNDDVVFSNSRAGRYLRIRNTRHGDGVVLLPVCESLIGIVRTYRYPISSWQWALPRGFAQSEDVLTSARNELAEEMGVIVDNSALSIVGTITPDSGLLETRVRVVHAVVQSVVTHPQDHEEVAELAWHNLTELRSMIARGDITDGFTLAALMLGEINGFVSG